MASPNQLRLASAIDAVHDKDGREFAIEEWKSAQESIAQFNDLGLRVRVFGISGVFLVAGYGIQSIKDDRLLVNWLHSSAAIVLLSAALLIATWMFDRLYYTPLLIAAVVYGQVLEHALRGGNEFLNAEALQLIDKIKIPGEKKKHSESEGPADSTHVFGKSGYISYYVSTLHPGLHKNLDWRLYFPLLLVLLAATCLLQLGYPVTPGPCE